MRLFYEHLGRGETKAESLRAAKLTFLHSGNQLSLPKYWGAFVLTGDGQAPIRPLLSWAWFIGPAVALALVTFLLYRCCFHRNRHRFRQKAPLAAAAPELDS
jgi:hypothetical protein